jgi:ABC-type Fe3+ transport system permease subunit
VIGHGGLLRQLLYDGPSPLPAAWAAVVRCFPCAVALLWPAVRQVPRALTDAARADGAPPALELWHAVRPLSAPAWGRAALAVAVLSLGELGAGKLAATPGGMTFAQKVFTQMHYGPKNDLAAMCLVLLAMVSPAALLLAAEVRRRQ